MSGGMNEGDNKVYREVNRSPSMEYSGIASECKTASYREKGDEFVETGIRIGKLVKEKNAAYGDSFVKCGEFLRLLYPDGIKPCQYEDLLALVRVFDKQMRIATDRDAIGESPWDDICGYANLRSTQLNK